MQVGKSNIYELFKGSKQYVIPSYQRPYSWREKECERLWKDIVEMESKKRPSHYSFYSGVKDLVHELPFDPLFNNYLICGHTHRRVIGEVVPGFMGVNVGSDYEDLKTFTLEL